MIFCTTSDRSTFGVVERNGGGVHIYLKKTVVEGTRVHDIRVHMTYMTLGMHTKSNFYEKDGYEAIFRL